MPDSHTALEAAMSDAEGLRSYLKKNKTPQVRSVEERELIKANCLAWFRNHRAIIRSSVADDLLEETDGAYNAILAAADRATSRPRYDVLLKGLRKLLSDLRSYVLAPTAVAVPTSDKPPAFDALVSDPKMREVLKRRWMECTKCVAAGAPLAATVMMGGLLESLLLARVNREVDKTQIFGAATAPKDRQSGKAIPLQEWTLRHYIDVAHELGWISPSAKDVGEVIRDYRNYVHPHKELLHSVALGDNDAHLFWEISKSISKQVLASAV
jgi:hypothetical protein